MSLVSNDGSQPFSAGAKCSSNRCLDLDYNDFCMNIEQEPRESRGSVSYTDYYSNEDGQIRRTANDNCFPIFVKLVVRPTADDSAELENPEDDEDHTLTLKQTEEQKKQDVQRIFEEKDAQAGAKSTSNYKKIGRFRVESTDISDNDVRIKETSSLGSSYSAEKNKHQPRQDAGAVPKRSSSLLRSQSVYTPKAPVPSSSRSAHLSKQNSLSAALDTDGPENWGVPPEDSARPTELNSTDAEQPVLTLASSFTDTANVTFGFDLPEDKKD